MATSEVLNELTIEGMGYLHIPDSDGDSRMQWDPSDVEQVEKARARFEEYTKPTSQGGKGFIAYRVDPKGGSGEVIRAFDPSAGRIVLRGHVVGG